MLKILSQTDRIQTTKLGGFYPYWTKINGQVVVADTAQEIISFLPNELRIVDPVSIIELLQFNYMLGNRTLVQGVHRMPWRAILLGDGTLERQDPIPHFTNHVEAEIAAKRLQTYLEEELYCIAKQYSKIYILLTGGLDSRIVAGILKKIEHKLQAEIVCVTWGQLQSRDVVYARQIAHWYEWEFVHIPYTRELAWDNVLRAATWGGSEVTGIHLHGMNWFRACDPHELVIAASFGDSVGRAEYSSVHLKDLTLGKLRNTQNLISASIVDKAIPIAMKDRELAWEGALALPDWVRCELDQQENYMRRMICHAMDYIRQFCNLHQAFTSEKVVSYMWSLAIDCRKDEIYFQLLKDLDHRLYSLPWARTGHAPDGTPEVNMKLTKNYHEWGRWLRYDLIDRIEDLAFSSGLEELGIFNRRAVSRLWKTWMDNPDVDHLGLGENILKLCTIELARRHFTLLPFREPTPIRDILSELRWRGSKKIKKIFLDF